MEDFQLILLEYFKKIQSSVNEDFYYKKFYEYCYFDCFGSCDICPIQNDCNYYDPDHLGGDFDESQTALFAID